MNRINATSQITNTMNNANLKLAAVPADQNSGLKAIELKDRGNEVIGWVEADCEFKPSKKSGTIAPAELRTILSDFLIQEATKKYISDLVEGRGRGAFDPELTRQIKSFFKLQEDREKARTYIQNFVEGNIKDSSDTTDLQSWIGTFLSAEKKKEDLLKTIQAETKAADDKAAQVLPSDEFTRAFQKEMDEAISDFLSSSGAEKKIEIPVTLTPPEGYIQDLINGKITEDSSEELRGYINGFLKIQDEKEEAEVPTGITLSFSQDLDLQRGLGITLDLKQDLDLRRGLQNKIQMYVK